MKNPLCEYKMSPDQIRLVVTMTLPECPPEQQLSPIIKSGIGDFPAPDQAIITADLDVVHVTEGRYRIIDLAC